MANEKKKTMISLEFAAEMIAATRLIFVKYPGFFYGRIPIPRFMNILHNEAKDSSRLESIWKDYDEALKEAIKLASFLAVIEKELSNSHITRRIQMNYAFHRFVYFDLRQIIDPFLHTESPISPEQKSPTSKENTLIMKRVFEELQHLPAFKREKEKQIQAGRLTEWKKEQRDKAIETYHKIKSRWLDKANNYARELMRSLFDEEVEENPVKSTDLFF